MIKRISVDITDNEYNLFSGIAKMNGLRIPDLMAILIRRRLKEANLLSNDIEKKNEINEDVINGKIQKELITEGGQIK